MLDRYPDARALLMDVDGTLLDSVDAQAHCWVRALQSFDYPVDYSQVRPRIGMGHDRILHELCGVSAASPRARRLLEVRDQLLRTHYLPWIRARHGAHQFLASMRQSGVRLGAVTSSGRPEALGLLGAGQLLTEFDHVVCRDDASGGKPAPDTLLVALERLRVRPEQALMVASSPHDVTAARAAGVACVGLQNADWPPAVLIGGLRVYANLHAVSGHWRGRPSRPHAA